MKKVLGKGLSSLIPDTYIKSSQAFNTPSEVGNQEGFQLIPIEQIRVNQDQPRKEFNPEAIEELAASIKEKGILQPVVVSKTDQGFTLICGERRLRAARLVGLPEIPAVIKEVAPEDFLEWALIENIQREDLNAIEEAEAYQRLLEDRKISQEDLALRLGKNRTTITNTIRLLRLPQDLRGYLSSGQLSAGHARALLSLLTPEHQRQLAKRIVEENPKRNTIKSMELHRLQFKKELEISLRLQMEIINGQAL